MIKNVLFLLVLVNAAHMIGSDAATSVNLGWLSNGCPRALKALVLQYARPTRDPITLKVIPAHRIVGSINERKACASRIITDLHINKISKSIAANSTPGYFAIDCKVVTKCEDTGKQEAWLFQCTFMDDSTWQLYVPRAISYTLNGGANPMLPIMRRMELSCSPVRFVYPSITSDFNLEFHETSNEDVVLLAEEISKYSLKQALGFTENDLVQFTDSHVTQLATTTDNSKSKKQQQI